VVEQQFLQQPGGKVLDTSDKGTPLPSKIRWMVFQGKTKSNYQLLEIRNRNRRKISFKKFQEILLIGHMISFLL
jgi:hypothetical protein